MRTPSSLSIIVTTYQWPEALHAVLRGLAEQSDPDFDIVVADDGSGPPTAACIARWKERFGDRLTHVRQEDEGPRMARVRNLGALASSGEFLVFLDGDCIPRWHFVAALRRAALPRWFLAGKRVQLSPSFSARVLERRTALGRWSTVALLLRPWRLDRWLDLTPRDRRRPWRPNLPDFAPEGNAYGFLLGAWRRDLVAVNGFDMRYVGFGEQDVDLAVRLRRLGLRCGFAGPRSTLLHLWHPVRRARGRATWWLLQETLASGHVEAPLGLRELAAEIGGDPGGSFRPRAGAHHPGR